MYKIFALIITMILVPLIFITSLVYIHNSPNTTSPNSFSNSVSSIKVNSQISSSSQSSLTSSSPQSSSSTSSLQEQGKVNEVIIPKTTSIEQKKVVIEEKSIVKKIITKSSSKSSKSSSVSPSSVSAIKKVDPRLKSWEEHYKGIESVPKILPENVLMVSKSKQTFELHRDGKVTLKGDITTGGSYLNPNNVWSETHNGIYWISYKSRDVSMKMFDTPEKVSDYFISLRGKHNGLNKTEEYVGIHDSVWRTKFGVGFDHKRKGTYGCITAPSGLVKKLYNIMEVNDLVFVVD